MNHHYSDITSLIAQDPKWFDEHAVPRYCIFTPEDVANIYADEVCLVEIACQSCHTRFKVAFSTTRFEMFKRAGEYLYAKLERKPLIEEVSEEKKRYSLEAAIQAQTIHYGDPPNNGCCLAGPTMNSVPLRVLEYWVRNRGEVKDGVIQNPSEYFKWNRVAELETEISPDWVG